MNAKSNSDNLHLAGDIANKKYCSHSEFYLSALCTYILGFSRQIFD